MKTRFVGIAVIAFLILSSCSGEPAVPVQTDAVSETTAATTPEIIYSDDCKADIEYFAISGENRFMVSPIEYAIDSENGVLSVDISYDSYVNIYTLENCIIDISVTDGEYSVGESLNPDGTVDLTRLTEIILTDGQGLHKKYDVVTERTVHQLPIVNIYTENTAGIDSIDRYEYTDMFFFIDAAGAEGFSSTEVMSGRLRGRGNSTWLWEKKPFRIKLDESISVLGLEKNRDWILLANYCDKSFLRNIIAYRMGHILDGLSWTPTQYPVDLFFNGEYQGVYTIGEHMEVGSGRVNIDESDDIGTGYLLEVGGTYEGEERSKYYFNTAMEMALRIVIQSPKEDVITDQQREYIEDYVNKAEEAIVSGVGYQEYIDVDSFIDWILIHELTYNLDSCFRRSCFMTKDKGGKLQMGPVWDFDIAFGNCDVDNQDYDDWVTVGDSYDFNESYVTVNWCNYLMDDSSFRQRLRERWSEVRVALLEEAMSSIDHYSEKIYASQEENFKVWQIWDERVGLESERNAEYNTYELQIQYLKDFINMRADWIDNNV